MSIISKIYRDEVELRYRLYPEGYTCNVNLADYAGFEAKKMYLLRASEFNNSAIAIYDLHQKVYLGLRTDFYKSSESIFYAEVNNRTEPLWFLPFLTKKDRFFVYDSILSVFDYLNLKQYSERMNYKLILDLVMAHPNGSFCRMMLKMMLAELDRDGKLWLMLGNVNVTLLKKADDRPPQHQLMNINTRKGVFFEHSANCQPLTSITLDSIPISQKIKNATKSPRHQDSQRNEY
ncbi:MAG: hypothetical protein GZ094_21245 [Mariniphaga sp.]|nr:hypothetical protein [Mariniphaga sp.]